MTNNHTRCHDLRLRPKTITQTILAAKTYDHDLVERGADLQVDTGMAEVGVVGAVHALTRRERTPMIKLTVVFPV